MRFWLLGASCLLVGFAATLSVRAQVADEPLPLVPTMQNVSADFPSQWPAGDWSAVPASQFQQFLSDRSIPPDATSPPDAYLFSTNYVAKLVGNRLEGDFELHIRNPRSESQFLPLATTSIALKELSWSDGPALWGNDSQGHVVIATRGVDGALQGKWSTIGTSSFGQLEFLFDLPSSSMTRLDFNLPEHLRLQSNSGITSDLGVDAMTGLRRWQLDLGRRRRVALTLMAATEIKPVTDLFARRTTSHSLRGDKIEVVADFDITVLSGPVPRLQFQFPIDLELTSISYGSDVALPVRLTQLKGRNVASIPADQFPEGRPVRVRVRGHQTVQWARGRQIPTVSLVGAKLLSSQQTLHVERPLVANEIELDGTQLLDMRVDSPQLETWTFQDTQPFPKLTASLGLPGPGLTAHVLAVADYSGTLPRLSSVLRLSTITGTPYSIECDVPAGWDVLAVTGADPGSQSTLSDFRVVTSEAGTSTLQIEFRTPFVPGVPREYRIDAIRHLPASSQNSPLPIILPTAAEVITGTLSLLPMAGQQAEVAGLPLLQTIEPPLAQQLELLHPGGKWSQATNVGLEALHSGGTMPTFSFRSILPDPLTDPLLDSAGPTLPVAPDRGSASHSSNRNAETSTSGGSSAGLMDRTSGVSESDASRGPSTPTTNAATSKDDIPEDRSASSSFDTSSILVPEEELTVPTLVDAELLTALAGAGADHHLHQATFRIGKPATKPMQFRLPAPAIVIGISIDGSIAKYDQLGDIVQVLAETTVRESIVIRYRTPVGSGVITENSTVPIPNWGSSPMPFQWRIRSSEERHCAEVTVPFGVVTSSGSGSWERRFFGPLARKQSADGASLFALVSNWWRSEPTSPDSPSGPISPPEINNNSTTAGGAAAGVSTTDSPSVLSLLTSDNVRSMDSIGVQQLDAGVTPRSVEMQIVRSAHTTRLSWCLLFAAFLVGILLRRRRRRRIRRLMSGWVTIQVLVCFLASEPYAVLCGAALMGTLFAILTPRSLIYPPRTAETDRSPAAVPPRQVVTASIGLLLVIGAISDWIPLRTAYSQDPITSPSVSPTTTPSTPPPSAATSNPNSVVPSPVSPSVTSPGMLVPVGVDGLPVDDVYLSPQWMKAFRTWRDSRPVEPDWLFRSARYLVHLDQPTPVIEAQYQVQFTRETSEVRVLFPIDRVTFNSVNDCWVDGQPAMVIPSALGDGVIVRVVLDRKPPATNQPAGTTAAPDAALSPVGSPAAPASVPETTESPAPEPVFPLEATAGQNASSSPGGASINPTLHRITLRFYAELKGTARDGSLVAGIPRISDTSVLIRQRPNSNLHMQINGHSEVVDPSGDTTPAPSFRPLGPVETLAVRWFPPMAAKLPSSKAKLIVTEVDTHPLRFDLRTTLPADVDGDGTPQGIRKLVLPANVLVSRLLPEGEVTWLTQRYSDRTELLYSIKQPGPQIEPIQVEFSLPAIHEARNGPNAVANASLTFPAWNWSSVAEEHLLLFKPVAGYTVQINSTDPTSSLRPVTPRDLEDQTTVLGLLNRYPGTLAFLAKTADPFSVRLTEIPRLIEQSIDVTMSVDKTTLLWNASLRCTVQGPATPIHRYRLDARIRNLTASVQQDGAERLHRLERNGDSIILILNSPRNGALDIRLTGTMPFTPGTNVNLPALEATGKVVRHVITIQNRSAWPMTLLRNSERVAPTGSAPVGVAPADQGEFVTRYSVIEPASTELTNPDSFKVDPGADAATVTSRSYLRADSSEQWTLETAYRVTPLLTALSQVLVEIPAAPSEGAVLTPASALVDRQSLPDGTTRLVLRANHGRPEFTFRLRTSITPPQRGEFWETPVPIVLSAKTASQELSLDDRFPFRPSSGCSEPVATPAKSDANNNRSATPTLSQPPLYRDYRMLRTVWQWVPNPNAFTPLQVPLVETSLWVDPSAGVVGTSQFWCIGENRVPLAFDLPAGVRLEQAFLGTRRLPVLEVDGVPTVSLPAGVGNEPLVLMWSSGLAAADIGSIQLPRLRDFSPDQQLLTCVSTPHIQFDAALTRVDEFQFQFQRLSSLFAAFETQSSRTFSFDSPLLLALNSADRSAIAVSRELPAPSDPRLEELKSLHTRWELQRNRVTFTPSESGASLPVGTAELELGSTAVAKFLVTSGDPVQWTTTASTDGSWQLPAVFVSLAIFALWWLRKSRLPARLGIFLARHPAAVLFAVGLFWLLFLTFPPAGLLFIVAAFPVALYQRAAAIRKAELYNASIRLALVNAAVSPASQTPASPEYPTL